MERHEQATERRRDRRPGPPSEHDAGGRGAAGAEQVFGGRRSTVERRRSAVADARPGRASHAGAVAVRHGRVSGHVLVRGRRVRCGHVGRVARTRRRRRLRVHHAGAHHLSAEHFR